MTEFSKTLDLSRWAKRSALDAHTITIRLLTGDEDGRALQMQRTGTNVVHARVQMSISEVDGSPMRPPCVQFEKWNSRTRAFVSSAWGHLHSLPDDLLADFEDSLGLGDWWDLRPWQDRLRDHALSLGFSDQQAEHALSVAGFSLKEVSLADEIEISKRIARNEPGLYTRYKGTIQQYESLDGKRVQIDSANTDRFVSEPWRGWNFWTLQLVHRAFARLNEPLDEVTDFLAESFAPTKSPPNAETE